MGGFGLGLIWGWLVVMVNPPDGKRGLSLCKLGAATALMAAEVLVLDEARSLLFFIGAMMLAALLHFAWIRELRGRFGSDG